MSATYNNDVTVVIMSNAEAELELANASFTGTKSSGVFLQEELIDSVQVLALGGFDLERVIGSGIAAAKAVGYSKGIYDAYTQSQRAYGKKLSESIAALTPATVITKSLTYTGSYRKGRYQIEITSDLMTDSDGRKFFEVSVRDEFITSGVVTAWKDSQKTGGVRIARELFVHDLDKGQFYFLDGNKKEGVYLGHTSVYNYVLNLIQSSGIIRAFTAVLNEIPQSEHRSIARSGLDTPQAQFLNVVKRMKANIKPLVADSKKAAAKATTK